MRQLQKSLKITMRAQVESKVSELLDLVGLSPPELYTDRVPHEFSGGQTQRIGIARAIALKPTYVVADEPVSALDMSVRAQILDLMKELQAKFKLTHLFIMYDLSVVRSMSTRVIVMYLGKIIELVEVGELYENPLHPYTKAILAATPIPNPKLTRSRKRIILKGDVPSRAPSGCRFHTRCPSAMSQCASVEPELVNMGKDHFVACCWDNHS